MGIGFTVKKLAEKYGTKCYAIPRFLLGFTVSTHIFTSYLPQLNPIHLTCVLIGLLFAPITLLTPNLIIAFLTTLFFSYAVTIGLTMQLELVFEREFNDYILTLGIAAVSGARHLYYYYKYDSLKSITSSNTDAKDKVIYIQ